MEIYVVREGDNVDQIALRYGVNVNTLIYNNQLEYPYRLAVGQALLIGEPGGGNEGPGRAERSIKPGMQNEQVWIRRPIVTGGYAYPFIEQSVLEQTLPYLTSLSVFSYGFTSEGILIAPETDDTRVVMEANLLGVIPILTLTPLGTDGHFNNQLVSDLVRSPISKQTLTEQLVQVLWEKGYGGVNIDFEYVKADDKTAFADFVRDLRTTLNLSGYTVSVALAPKTSSNQPGLLYEGNDYRLLGEAADEVFLMTYEWGYTYGPPMAVAPVNMVRRVVEYAVTEIPRAKISLGIPNYGYDWPLPYVQGTTRARSLGVIEAVRLAVDFGVPIQYDATAQSPFFRYWQYGVEHEVWFEDVRSMKAKFGLIQEFGLRGAGYWQLMRLFRANWLLLEDMFGIGRSGAFFD